MPNGFRASFSKARKAGKKTFSWSGKKFTTQTAEEKALTMTDKQVSRKASDTHKAASMNAIEREQANKGYRKRTVSESKYKSDAEIAQSYVNEKTHRIGDKIKAQGGSTKGIKGAAYATKRPTRLSRNKPNPIKVRYSTKKL
jgi:hypothetical protein